MTKYKEYLRAKGIKLECDYEFLPCGYIEAIQTRVMDSCIIAVTYSNCAAPEYAVYDRHGEFDWFDTYVDASCIECFNCDPEFTYWMYDTSYKISTTLYTAAVGMYKNDEKVRIAFKHMRAGIMDEQVFYKWLVRQYSKHIRSV